MKFIKEILPFFEAGRYLSDRFSENKLENRISENLDSEIIKKNPYLASYLKIADIEKALDAEIETDDILKYYFTPLKTKEELPHEVLSLGNTILTIPAETPCDISFDELTERYRNLPQEEVFRSIYNSSLFSTSTFHANDCGSISDFISMTDSILADPQDKWNLIDVISNIVRHLETLRPVVKKAEEIILRFLPEFEHILSDCEKEFSIEQRAREAVDLIGIKLSETDYDNLVIYPSLMMFNGISISSCSNEDLNIKLGVYVLPLLRGRNNSPTFDSYLNLLKLLSDGTRLKVLIELCGRESFGQELSERFGSTRNAMYYHIEKLSGSGFLNRTENGYRTLYTMNKQNVYEKLTALRDFLVDGWKPGDPV